MSLFGRKRASIDLSKKGGMNIRFGVLGNYGLIIVLIFVSLLSLILAFHFYRQNNAFKEAITHAPTTLPTEDPVSQAIASVEKHLMLPQGERPQVARVTDLKPLANIPFFGNALTGDEVLVYCKTSLSVLYSPSRDKVIEVSRQLVGGSCK